MKNKKLIIVILLLVAVSTFFGGTLAYFMWVTSDEQETGISFRVDENALGANINATIEGNANVSSNDVLLKPTECTNSDYAIIKTVPITYKNGSRQSAKITATLSVTAFDLRDTAYVPNSTKLESLKYALTTSSSNCTTDVLESGSFKNLTFSSGLANNLPLALFNHTIIAPANMTEEATKTYYLWVWLDSGYTHTNVGSVNSDPMQGLSLTAKWSGTIEQVDIKPEPEAPVLDNGLIPVKLSSTGTVTTVSSGDSSWYNYDNKEWANAVLVKENGTKDRTFYKNTPGETVNQDDILAYYVWIPRYSYRIPYSRKCSVFTTMYDEDTLNNAVDELVNEIPECYAPYTMTETEKDFLVKVLYQESVNEGLTYTEDDVLQIVNNALDTGYLTGEIDGEVVNVSLISFVDGELTVTPGDFNPDKSLVNEELIEITKTLPTSIDISFEGKSSTVLAGDAVNSYRTHPAFVWDGNTVAGIWVGKFETTGDAATPTILPNKSALTGHNVSTQFTTSLEFAGGTLTNGDVTFSGSNKYGLTNLVDSHMMKNSEWGAVVYLSHSVYGINSEIRINNNSNLITGCGASSENSSATTLCEISYNSTSTPQSTTGNITGVYDMAGGAWEYIMGVLADMNGRPISGGELTENSGFNGAVGNGEMTSGIDFPPSKYYDLYTSTDPLTACNGGICYGHALSETANWYDNSFDFFIGYMTWLIRGGVIELTDGAFSLSAGYGDSGLGFLSWRSVLVK